MRTYLRSMLTKLTRVAQRRPRLFAAVLFALLGLLFPLATFLPAATVWGPPGQRLENALLYGAVPALAAGLSGAFVGARILLSRRDPSAARAVLQGMLTVLVAHVLFAPPFALGLFGVGDLSLAGAARGIAGVFLYGLLGAGGFTLPLGVFGGWFLRELRRQRPRRRLSDVDSAGQEVEEEDGNRG